MVKIASSQNNPQVKEGAVEVSDDEFKTLSAEEAAAWRLSHPQTSPWHVLLLQIGIGALMVLLTGLFSREFHLAASVAWGCASAVIPAVVFIRALSRQMRQIQPKAVLVGLFFWELVKIILTVALLLVAPKVISNLSWLALVAGFVVTIKVYWLAMALGYMQRKSKPTIF